MDSCFCLLNAFFQIYIYVTDICILWSFVFPFIRSFDHMNNSIWKSHSNCMCVQLIYSVLIFQKNTPSIRMTSFSPFDLTNTHGEFHYLSIRIDCSFIARILFGACWFRWCIVLQFPKEIIIQYSASTPFNLQITVQKIYFWLHHIDL